MEGQSSDKLILDHLNINSIRNKFETLKFIIDHNIDKFLIADTRLDDSFPAAQLKAETRLDDSFPTVYFLIKGFSALYRCDRYFKGGSIFL